MGLGLAQPSLHHATYDGVAPFASANAAAYAFDEVTRIPAELSDQREFARSAAQDPLRNAPAGQLLTGLRGKDVIFVFVESYGRVRRAGLVVRPGHRPAARPRARSSLDADGFGSRSAFLTSPTFGAHQLARALHLPVRALGRTASSGTTC